LALDLEAVLVSAENAREIQIKDMAQKEASIFPQVMKSSSI